MTTVSVAFLFLEILIITVGVLIAYKRGLGRSAVRLAYLCVIGVAAFFIARRISFSVSTPIYHFVYGILPSYDVQHLLEKSHELELLIENIIGAILTPLVFASLFFVLQLLTLVFFKKISNKIVSLVTKNHDAPSGASKWLGAAVGLVSSVAVAAILLSPVYTAIHVIDNTSPETIAIFFGETDEHEVQIKANTQSRVLKASTAMAKFEIKPSFAVTKFHPISDFISNAATKYSVPDAHEEESASHSLPVLVDIIADILYVHKSTISHGGSGMDALNNSVAAVTPHLDESITVRDAAASALCALGEILIEDHEFMGIALPENQNVLFEGITNNILETMAHTTLNSVDENMTMIFGNISNELMPEHKRHNVSAPECNPDVHYGKEGLLLTMDHMKSDKNADTQAMLKQALEIFKDSPEMTSMINEMLADYIASQIPTDANIGADAIKDILDNANIDLSKIDITNITKDDIKDIISSSDVVLDESTLDSIRDYLGDDSITKEDVDKFLEDGNIDDNIDLGDIDLDNIDFNDIDISNIDIYSVDFSTLSPEQIEALRAIHGDIIDEFLD